MPDLQANFNRQLRKWSEFLEKLRNSTGILRLVEVVERGVSGGVVFVVNTSRRPAKGREFGGGYPIVFRP